MPVNQGSNSPGWDARIGKLGSYASEWVNQLRYRRYGLTHSKYFSTLLELNNQHQDAALVADSAETAKYSFIKKFWNQPGYCLYDVIDENGNPDATVRPNQLFAISLPFALIEDDKAESILNVVEEQLYTPVGLKSLPKYDAHYVPVYGGDAYHRDSSYHEGTVWSWLLGPYIDAVMKLPNYTDPNGLSGFNKAQKIIESFKYHLNEGLP
jgi:predicted glycogen debranching enzyme